MLYKIKRVSLLVALILCVASVSVGAATTLQVASWWSFEDGSSLDEFKLAFEAANPDLKINYVQIPSSEYYTKVLTMIAGGTPPRMWSCWAWISSVPGCPETLYKI